MFDRLDSIVETFSNVMWGPHLLVLLLGGGIFFTFYSRFLPFYYIKHGFSILLGKYDNSEDPGQINHFQALSSALSSTVGMGNISGVALAIHAGGPGALFWMWISAIVGMSTKYFTCTLAILYRGTDENGEIQGGPMYVIQEGISKINKDGYFFNKSSYPIIGKVLAYMFATAGLFGCFSLFQANQLAQIIEDQIYIPLLNNQSYLIEIQNNINRITDLLNKDRYPLDKIISFLLFIGKIIVGIFLSGIISLVIFGGIRKIGQVAARLVPAMVVLYMICGFIIIIANINNFQNILMLIFRDAFTGSAVAGGTLGSVMIIGIRRAAFSNEAGIGTESMAHGAAITKEPVREGLVAMLGPLIDTIVVCSITGFAILSTGVWENKELNGISMTAEAFKSGLPFMGEIILLFIVLIFSITTIIGYSYYGSKCTAFLFGNKWKQPYRLLYTLSLIPASVISIDLVINYVDGMFAVMAIPTMISTLYLAPKVMKVSKDYFRKLDSATN